MATKLTHKERIEKEHIALMRHKKTMVLGPTIMVGSVTISDCPTAYTNGRDVTYGRGFIDQCSTGQLRATILHENWHKALMHLRVYENLMKKEGQQIVNMAMDFVVNRAIAKLAKEEPSLVALWDGIVLDGKPIEYCLDEKYEDEAVWDTPRIVEDLRQNCSGKGLSGPGEPGDQPGGESGHDWEGAKQLTAEEKEQLAKDIESALRQGKELAKQFSADMPRSIGDLLTPAVDWGHALRDYVTERSKGGEFQTFARPNRRFMGSGQYRPSHYTEVVRSLGFFIDMSGSVGPDDVREVLTELGSCIETVRPECVDILYWNTAVSRHEHYEGSDVYGIMQTTKPTGTGGTAPSCVIPFCAERNIVPTVAIWLSDGYVGSDWAEGLGVPAFWVITSTGVCPPHLPHVKLPKRG